MLFSYIWNDFESLSFNPHVLRGAGWAVSSGVTEPPASLQDFPDPLPGHTSQPGALQAQGLPGAPQAQALCLGMGFVFSYPRELAQSLCPPHHLVCYMRTQG